MNIGQAAKSSGVSAKMIRYYEKTDLIKAAERSAAGYRVYSNVDVETLKFIRRARDLGFSVAEIHELLALWQDGNRASSEVKMLAKAHIARLVEKIGQLQGMVGTLSELAARCNDDDRPECPILRDIARGSRAEPVQAVEHKFGAARFR